MHYIVPISVGGVRSQKPNAPNFGGGRSKEHPNAKESHDI